jgi:NhaA family Na+:H+ antiporter
MPADPGHLSPAFKQFFDSEKAAGILLVACTAIALVLANSAFGDTYRHLWEWDVAGLTLEQWINDGFMAVFFLLIGLELERELYRGELSQARRALLPVIAAVGGMIIPASIHYALNANSPSAVGAGIPMATDIAFALGVLAVLGSRIPSALKVFVVAFAVIDDLGAIIVIATFYTTGLVAMYLVGAIAVLALLVLLNRTFRVMALSPYLIGGAAMWWLLHRSGVHATLAGVALAFAIPFSPRDRDAMSPSHKLELRLNRPVAFIVLPLFALANTGVLIEPGWTQRLGDPNSLGILLGLTLGKPIGVAAFSYAAVATGLCRLPTQVNWAHMVGAGLLGGIGFTMSIFITNLAFAGEQETVNTSKLAILTASLVAGFAGYAWLRFIGGDRTEATAV